MIVQNNIRTHGCVYETVFIANIFGRMLSRLPRELLEELVTKRKIYSFAYIDNKLEVWVDGTRIYVVRDVSSRSKNDDGIYLTTSVWLVDIRINSTSVDIYSRPSEMHLLVDECDMESFHRSIDAIPFCEGYLRATNHIYVGPRDT